MLSTKPMLSEWQLKLHLVSRHVQLSYHRPILGEGVATFLLWTPALTGFVQYRPGADKKAFGRAGRYYMRGRGPFGWESLERPGPIFLVEGIFDACRLHSMGVAALAALSNDPGPSFMEQLYGLGRPIVAVCDGDAAGRKLAKYGHDFIECPSSQDFSDVSEEFAWHVVNKFRG